MDIFKIAKASKKKYEEERKDNRKKLARELKSIIDNAEYTNLKQRDVLEVAEKVIKEICKY